MTADLQALLDQAAHLQLPEAERKVLVVDDEEVVARMLSALLGREGLLVEGVGTGAAALAALHQGGFAVALVDKNLPDVGGIDVVRKARTFAPRVECLLMTGYGDLESAVLAMDAGATGYLKKPFDPALVVARVQAAMARATAATRADFLLEELKRMYAELYRAQTELGMAGEVQRAWLAQALFEPKKVLSQGVAAVIDAERAATEQQERLDALQALLALTPDAPDVEPLREQNAQVLEAVKRVQQVIEQAFAALANAG